MALRAPKPRDELGEMLSRVEHGRERIVIERRGKPVAALIPIEDLELLGALEGQMDVERVREALAEMERTGERPTAYEEVRRKLGLA
jgi:prevent-host-death family protein